MSIGDDDSLQRWIETADQEDILRRLLVRMLLQRKRSAIQMANSAPPTASAAERLNRKRFARSQLAKEARRLNGSSRPPIDKQVLIFRYADDAVLNALLPGRTRLWRPALKRDRKATPSTVTEPSTIGNTSPAGLARSSSARAQSRHPEGQQRVMSGRCRSGGQGKARF